MLARIPKLSKKLPLVIPAAQLVFNGSLMQRLLADAANLYLNLGGDPHLCWPVNKPQQEILTDITKKCRELLDKNFTRSWGEGDKKHLWVSPVLDYDEAASSFCLWINSEVYSCLAIEPFTDKGGKNRKLQLFVRDIFRAFQRCPSLPLTSLDDAFDMFYEWMLHDEPENYRNRRKATDRFSKYMGTGHPGKIGPSFDEIVQQLPSRYQAIKKTLTPKERKWVEKCFLLFKTSSDFSKQGYGDSFVDSEVYDDEYTSIESAVCLLFDDEDTETWSGWQNDSYGNNGPATVAFHLRDKKDCQAAQSFAEMLYLAHFILANVPFKKPGKE